MRTSWLRFVLTLFAAAAPGVVGQDHPPEAVSNAIDAFERRDFPVAEKDLTDYLRAEPKDPNALGFLGIVLDQEHKYAAADQAYRRALALGRSPQLLNNYGNHLVATGRTSEARRIFLDVLALDPNHANALRQLASIDLEEKRPAEALELLVRAKRADPGSADVESMLARTAAELGYFGDAAEAWNAYLKLKPEDAVARRERAFDESAIGENTQSALADLQAFVRAHPRDAVGHYELGTAEASNDNAAAKKEFDTAIELKPDFAPAHFSRGLVLYREGQTQPALAEFQLAAKEEPDNATILDHIGETDLSLGRDQDAVRVLRKASGIAPKNTVVLLHLGRALSKTGQQQEAAAVLAKYRELGGPKQSLPHPAGLLDFLSLPHEEQMARYRAGVERTVKNDPQNVEAQTRLLSLLLADGEMENAASVARTIAGLKPPPSVVEDVEQELKAAGQEATAREFKQLVGR